MSIDWTTQSLPRRRRGDARARFAFLTLLATTAAILAGAAAQNAALATRFVIVTADGEMLADVHGSVAGINNAKLAGLIEAGITDHHLLICDKVTDGGSWRKRLDWYVANDRKSPTVTVTARLSEDGRLVTTRATKAIAPSAAPDAVFVADVARIKDSILPRAVAETARVRACAGNAERG